ncbi:hypothetical protein Poly24_48960 [Rosistilla carotiformis]|uniref:Uncharacterized protein n=1 Tax=Rosistilla carotiformis TaxID=2528017 RepID=A0A518K041_9BACT|nr:hypothetical protein [Rosistilla carotiformis]QDV71162.1 hypothetical protein Poly24_48960 [Rosistilla carotiformis]
MPQVKEVPRWCRRCREVVPHEFYENISRGTVIALSVASLGVAYPFLNRYHMKSQNRCLFCNAENNGPYFSRQRKRQRQQSNTSTQMLRLQ